MIKYRHITIAKKGGNRVKGVRHIVEVEKIFDYKGFNLFLHKANPYDNLWKVSETLTGFTTSSNTNKGDYQGHKNSSKAIKQAKANIDNYLKTGVPESIISESFKDITTRESLYTKLFKAKVL